MTPCLKCAICQESSPLASYHKSLQEIQAVVEQQCRSCSFLPGCTFSEFSRGLFFLKEHVISLQVLCFLVTAFLHLSFMAAFSWMLVEGLLLWSKVVAVNMSEDRRMKFYYATGWGIYRLRNMHQLFSIANVSENRRNSPRSGAVRPMLGLAQYESLLSLFLRGFHTLMYQITTLKM